MACCGRAAHPVLGHTGRYPFRGALSPIHRAAGTTRARVVRARVLPRQPTVGRGVAEARDVAQREADSPVVQGGCGDITPRGPGARGAAAAVHPSLNVDIHEEVAFRQQRVERRDRKLLALKSLRRAEMDRLVMRTDRGDAEVEYWKATELDKIADLHAQALASLVVNARDAADMVECNMARGEGGGAYDSPTSRATATAHRLEARLAALTGPNVPFAEIVAYRKKLAGFDSFVSAVEEAIGTPECLRSLPVLADTPFAVQRDDEQPFQPMQIEWRSSARTRNRPRYRAMAAATAPGAREGSPYDLDSYDGVQVPHNTPPRALMWTGNDLAGDAMSLVEVPEGESAQTSIAKAIRDAVYGTQRRIELSKRDETAGSAPLDALKRRHDEQEAAELAQHVAALDALHRHLTRFV
jgi:hypothetical protein